MDLFRSMDIAASGMEAEQFRMQVIADNIANAQTSYDIEGNPYRKKVAMISSKGAPVFADFLPAGLFSDEDIGGSGVKVDGVAQINSDIKYVYDPDHPQAVKEGKWKGYVPMNSINIIEEMTNLISASRAYEANATVVEAAKSMAMRALDIGRGA